MQINVIVEEGALTSKHALANTLKKQLKRAIWPREFFHQQILKVFPGSRHIKDNDFDIVVPRNVAPRAASGLVLHYSSYA